MEEIRFETELAASGQITDTRTNFFQQLKHVVEQ